MEQLTILYPIKCCGCIKHINTLNSSTIRVIIVNGFLKYKRAHMDVECFFLNPNCRWEVSMISAYRVNIMRSKSLEKIELRVIAR